MKFSFLTTIFFIFMTMSLSMAVATDTGETESYSGFGSPFTETAHPGFQDPVTPDTLPDIEPAGGAMDSGAEDPAAKPDKPDCTDENRANENRAEANGDINGEKPCAD